MDPLDLNIKFRLHQENTEDNLLYLLTFVKTLLSERYIVAVEADATRPHFQCFLSIPLVVGEDGDLKKAMKRVRNAFRYHYRDLLEAMPAGKKGNSLYSLTMVQENSSLPLEYCAYLLKENCLDFVGFSEEERAAIFDYNNRVVAERTAKLAKKKQSQFAEVEQSLLSICEKVIEDGTEYYEIDTSGLRQTATKERLSEYLISLFVVDYFIKNELMIRKFSLVSIAQTLSARYLPHYRGYLANSICEAITNK